MNLFKFERAVKVVIVINVKKKLVPKKIRNDLKLESYTNISFILTYYFITSTTGIPIIKFI